MKNKKKETIEEKLKRLDLDTLPELSINLFNQISSDWEYISLGYDALPSITDYPKTKPRSATFVVALEWSWSPVHSRSDRYYISTNKSRTHWFFWYSYYDDNYDFSWKHKIVAIGPKKGINKYEAAKKLLEIFWIGERSEYDSPDDSFSYYEFGILSDKEVSPIAKKVLQ